MSWIYSNRQRSKMALGLGVLFLLIIFTNWFMNFSMNRVSWQFDSVYHDRLVPSLDISAMLEHHYESRALLEQFIAVEDAHTQKRLQQSIAVHTAALDSLQHKFKSTYLTNKERQYLHQYNRSATAWQQLQRQLITLRNTHNQETAINLYQQQGQGTFTRVLEPLHLLLKLQEEVGQTLHQAANQQVKALKTLSYLVIALAVLLALFITVLLQTSRKLKHLKPQQFNLN